MNKTHIALGIVAVIVGAGWWYTAIVNETSSPDVVNPNPTSADNAPTGSLHNLPVPDGVSSARTFVSEASGVPVGEVIVMSAYEMEWPNSCLGLAGPDELCAEVITPGYEVTLVAHGEEYTVRVNETGSVIREEK